WQEQKEGAIVSGQVEVKNNLLLEAIAADITFYIGTRNGEAVPADYHELARLWQFAHNGRDLSGGGDSHRLPLQATDIHVESLPFAKADADTPERWRLPKDSPLGIGGAGTSDRSLPAYVGALPPPEVAPWDWDRTWRMRMKKAEEKK